MLAILLWPSKTAFKLKLSVAATKSLRIVTLVATFSAIGFLSHSYAASNEFKAYLQKQTPPETPFQLAQQNPYFKTLAMDLMMAALFHSSIRYGVDSNVKIFAEWAEEKIVWNPHIIYFRLGTEAYLYLKQTQQACTIAKTGSSIYPTDKILIDVVTKCDKNLKRYKKL